MRCDEQMPLPCCLMVKCPTDKQLLCGLKPIGAISGPVRLLDGLRGKHRMHRIFSKPFTRLEGS